MINELPRVRGLPTAVRIALQRSLARTPRDRFPHAGAFAEAIAIGLPSDPGSEPISDPGSVDADDQTLLAPDATAEGLRVATPVRQIAVGTRFITPVAVNGLVGSARSPSLESVLPPRRMPQPAPTPPPPAVRPLPRHSLLRTALVAGWNFLVTSAAIVLFTGAWFVAVTSLQQAENDMLYLAAASTVALTPFALHRLMGSRGSLRFALFSSILASLATVYLVADGGEADTRLVLAALFMAQLLAVVFAEILTRRRAPYELEEELLNLPG